MTLRICTVSIIFFASLTLCAGNNDTKSDHRRDEFYEYDIEDGDVHKVRRQVTAYSKRGIKAPFKISAKCFRTTRGALQYAVNSVEIYLSRSYEIEGREGEFQRASAAFHHQMHAHDLQHYDMHHGQCLFGLPSASGNLFRSILYTAGFRFPRATWQVIEDIFHGTCICLNG